MKQKLIETIGIIMTKEKDDPKFLLKNRSAYFGRIVLKGETLEQSLSKTFIDIGLDISDLDTIRFAEINESSENLQICYVLECDLESLQEYIKDTEFTIGDSKENIVLILKNKIEGK